MVNTILLKKVNDWWDSLDGADRLDICKWDPNWDEFVNTICYEDGCEHGKEDLDWDETASEYWDALDDEEKIQIYRDCNESKNVVMNFDMFIKENYK